MFTGGRETAIQEGWWSAGTVHEGLGNHGGVEILL